MCGLYMPNLLLYLFKKLFEFLYKCFYYCSDFEYDRLDLHVTNGCDIGAGLMLAEFDATARENRTCHYMKSGMYIDLFI